MNFINLDLCRRAFLPVLFVAVDVYRADERHHIALAEPVENHISIAIPCDAIEEVRLGFFLTITLRTVAGNRKLAVAILTCGLDLRIGS